MVIQSIRDIIIKMDGEEFTRFYRTLLAELQISRHASCELQMWAILTASQDKAIEVLALMGKEIPS